MFSCLKHFLKVLLTIPARGCSFSLIFSHPVSSGSVGLFHQAQRCCGPLVQYIPDIFSDPRLETLLLVEDESLGGCGSFRVKILSSWE